VDFRFGVRSLEFAVGMGMGMGMGMEGVPFPVQSRSVGAGSEVKYEPSMPCSGPWYTAFEDP